MPALGPLVRLLDGAGDLGVCFGGPVEVLVGRDDLGDIVLDQGTLDQVDELLGGERVQLDPPHAQERDLVLFGTACAQPIVTYRLQVVRADRLVLEAVDLV